MGALLGLVVVGTTSFTRGAAPTLPPSLKTGCAEIRNKNGLQGFASGLSARGLFFRGHSSALACISALNSHSEAMARNTLSSSARTSLNCEGGKSSGKSSFEVLSMASIVLATH
jgi:hypothetical protein